MTLVGILKVEGLKFILNPNYLEVKLCPTHGMGGNRSVRCVKISFIIPSSIDIVLGVFMSFSLIILL